MRPGSEPRAARLAGLAGVLGLLLSMPALAQPADAALAEQLFEEGKRLLEEEKYGEACPKLAESHRLDPAGGTILLLAQCHEAQGKLATAWAEYKESLARAVEAGNTRRERISRERIAALAPLLSTLTIQVPPEVARLPGFRLTRGGVPLGSVLWGTAMTVDPGSHEIQASADGFEVWSQRVEIQPRADRASLTVPMLRALPEATPAASSSSLPAASSEPPVSSSAPALPPPLPAAESSRTVAFVSIGVGVLGLGLGTYFGLRSFSDARFANDRCPEKNCADAEATRRGNDAVREANISNLAFGLGLAATGVGAYFWFSEPSSPKQALRIQPTVARDRIFVSGGVNW